jgi:ankyrin repeat protein
METKYRTPLILQVTVFILWFTIVQVDGADYYISHSGNDSNTGISSTKAWQSISKVNNIAFDAGDRILFEGGKKFIGSLKFDAHDNGTRVKPITVGSYGEGRAIISSGTDHGFYALNCAGLCVEDLVFVGAGRTVDAISSGILFRTDLDTGERLEYVHIDKVDVSGYRQKGISIEAVNTRNSGFIDIRLTNAEVHDNGYAGISSIGWPPNPSNRPLRDVYIGNCKVYNNAGVPGMKPHSGNGIVISGVDGAVIEYCTAFNNGWLCDDPGGGPVGIWAWEASNVIIQFCESHHNKTSGGDGGGFDLDGGCVNCVMQYNYSHDNEGAGYLICQFSGASEFRNNVCRYNISENDGIGSRDPMGAIQFYSSGSSGGIKNTQVYNNTVYVSSATRGAGIIAGSRTYNTSIYNNIIVTAPGKRVVSVGNTSGGYSFRGNCYWSSGSPLKIVWGNKTYTSLAAWRSATNQERSEKSDVGFEINPMLVSLGKGGTISDPTKLDGLAAYKLRIDSPVIDSGINLKTVYGIDSGNRDLFGNAIFQGEGQDMGAHEIVLEDNLWLHMAAASGNIERVRELVLAGANVNEKDKYDQTPMAYAIRHDHKEVIELLMTQGADLSLHLATYLANTERLLYLINNDVNVNTKNEYGQIPLHLAARSGHKEVAKLLIANGSLVDEKEDRNHFTPLHYAAKCGHIDLADLLIANSAATNTRDHDGFTPLHWATFCNRTQLVRLLLAKGAKVDAKDKCDRTALNYALTSGEGFSHIIELLLVNGAEPRFKTEDGRTPLLSAVSNNQLSLVKLLIDNGADVNAKDKWGRISLHYAAIKGHREIVELLLAHDADVGIGEHLGRTAAEFAMRSSHTEIVQLLISKGADISPLHFALYMKNEAKARGLIDSGADVSSRTPSGTVPLNRAVLAGFTGIVELLIAKGADVNAGYFWGWTPLHGAAEEGHKEIAELLIAKGANVNARDGASRTPLYYAQEGDYAEIVELLLKHGAKE